jgi:type I restriction enzyme S subunit
MPGEGPDRLEWFDGQVPEERVKLRLRNAIEAKAIQLKKHLDCGYIRAGQPAVIAVSGAMLPYCFCGYPVPFIVGAVFAIGHQVLHFDRVTLSPVGQSVEHCDEVGKVNQVSIKTDIFLTKEYAHVSAVLYTNTHWVRPAETPGADFIVVHNPCATNPLPRGWLQLGDEYWSDGSRLR